MKIISVSNQAICIDAISGLKLLPKGSIDLIVTSPPYNCRTKYPHGDEMHWEEYYRNFYCVLLECHRVLRTGATLALNVPSTVRFQFDHKFQYSWQDYVRDYPTHRGGKHIKGRGRIEPVGFKVYDMMFRIFFFTRAPIVWVKGKAPTSIATESRMGSDNNPYLRTCHEFILLASKHQWHHRGGTGRRGVKAVPYAEYTKDVWYIPARSSRYHPAVFPLEIPRRLIRLFCHAPDSIVLDPFCGLGTTLEAAKNAGLRYVGFDIVKQYCQLANTNLSKIINSV